MDELKVSITYQQTMDLYRLNKLKTLEENISDICEKKGLTSPELFGLKLVNGSEKYYIRDLSNVPQASELELVSSVGVACQCVFTTTNIDGKPNFSYLNELFMDQVFLDTLVQNGFEEDLQIMIEKASGTDLSICMNTLVQLIKLNNVDKIEYNVLRKIINIVRDEKPNTLDLLYSKKPTNSVFESAVTLLCQILYRKKETYHGYKFMILQSIDISHLMSFCMIRSDSLQIRIIQLVNAIVTSVKEDQQHSLIEKLNYRTNKTHIFENIIKRGKVSKPMAHELYVYQTYILGRLKNTLDTKVDIDASYLKEYEQIEKRLNRVSDLLEFQESMSRGKWNSSDALLARIDERYSFITSSERESTITNKSLSNYSDYSGEDNMISSCAYNNLEHYKRNHPINFNQSFLEEINCQTGIKQTSERWKLQRNSCRITKMLGKILHIGARPTKEGENYHPLVFNTQLPNEFLLELFCRTMWLLSKTRRDMRAYVHEDFEKVLRVLEKQIKMVLHKKPLDLKELLTYMKETTYDIVSQQWEQERETEYRYIIDSHPAVQELKTNFVQGNEKRIREQRMAVLKSGGYFPKLPEKKHKQVHFLAKVSENEKLLCVTDNNNEKKNYNISDIRHVIIGKNCPHVKDNTVKQEKRAFSLQMSGNDHINFLAKDEKVASYWVDGFHMLLGKEDRSEMYEKEMNTLIEMDCALQLLELQGVRIPTKPPPIPPLPKPSIPPKSAYLVRCQTMDRQKNLS